MTSIEHLAWRELARLEFVEFVEYDGRGGWIRAPHLEKLAAVLQSVSEDTANGKPRRVIVMMPPRHGKSEMVSKKFPPWHIGKYPDHEIILGSYTADLALDHSRVARNTLAEHSDLFGVSVARDSSAVTRWGIANNRGGLFAAGVGGPITGRGAHIGIIDDPVKNAEEAASETVRERIWNWYTTTFYTRLAPGGSVIVVMTRWHEDDLVGRLLQQESEIPWEVIRLSAVAGEDDPLGRKPGEALWPERYPVETLEEIKTTLGSYYWEALYQQNPIRREGGMFKRSWFEIVDSAPASKNAARYWDLAATEEKPGADPDYTVGAKIVEKDGVYYICDIRRERGTPKTIERLVRQTAETDERHTLIYMEQEPGSSGKNTIDHYARNILRGFPFRGDKKTGPKVLNAEVLAAAAEAGNVRLVKGAWNKEFLDELEAFPHGRHDDQVDAASGALNKLNRRPQYRAAPSL